MKKEDPKQQFDLSSKIVTFQGHTNLKRQNQLQRLDKKKLDIHLGPYSQKTIQLYEKVEKIKEKISERKKDDDKISLMSHFEQHIGNKHDVLSDESQIRQLIKEMTNNSNQSLEELGGKFKSVKNTTSQQNEIYLP